MADDDWVDVTPARAMRHAPAPADDWIDVKPSGFDAQAAADQAARAPTMPAKRQVVAPPTVPITKLSPTEEAKYQAWKATLPPRLQYEGDYDLRGFYRENPHFSVDTPGQHMTDKFKLPNHETFSNESQYYNDTTRDFGGEWRRGPGGAWIFAPNNPANKGLIVEDANGDRVHAGRPAGLPHGDIAAEPNFSVQEAPTGAIRGTGPVPLIINSERPDVAQAARANIPRESPQDANNPYRHDPLARSIVGGLMGGGAAALAAPLGAVASAAIGAGTAGGVESEATTPGEFARDVGASAALGGGLAWGAQWFRNATSRANLDLAREYSSKVRPTTKNATTLRQVGPDAVAKTVRDEGIATAHTPAEALAMAKAAGARVTPAITDAWGALSNAATADGFYASGKDITAALEPIRARWARNTEGQRLAEKVTAKINDIVKLHGDKISPVQLHTEIQAAEELGYAGAGASPSDKVSARMYREMGAALRGVLDPVVEQAAKKNPLAREAVDRLAELNPRFRVLKALTPALEREANAETTKKSLYQRLIAAPVRTVAHGVGDAVGGVAGGAATVAAAPGYATDVMIARLMNARAMGNVTPELLGEAVRANVPQAIIGMAQTPAVRQAAHGAAVGAYRTLLPLIPSHVPFMGEHHEHESSGGGEE